MTRYLPLLLLTLCACDGLEPLERTTGDPASAAYVPAAPGDVTSVLYSDYSAPAGRATLRWRSQSTFETGFVVEVSVDGGEWSEVTRLEAGANQWAGKVKQAFEARYGVRAFARRPDGTEVFSERAESEPLTVLNPNNIEPTLYVLDARALHLLMAPDFIRAFPSIRVHVRRFADGVPEETERIVPNEQITRVPRIHGAPWHDSEPPRTVAADSFAVRSGTSYRYDVRFSFPGGTPSAVRATNTVTPPPVWPDDARVSADIVERWKQPTGDEIVVQIFFTLPNLGTRFALILRDDLGVDIARQFNGGIDGFDLIGWSQWSFTTITLPVSKLDTARTYRFALEQADGSLFPPSQPLRYDASRSRWTL